MSKAAAAAAAAAKAWFPTAGAIVLVAAAFAFFSRFPLGHQVSTNVAFRALKARELGRRVVMPPFTVDGSA